jgi:hypothetical protein
LDTAGTITGTNAATLNIPNAKVWQAGTYSVTVSGSAPCTPATSNNAIFVVNQDIDITTQPLPAIICQGGNTTFTVVATGTISSYVWRRNGLPVSGEFTVEKILLH